MTIRILEHLDQFGFAVVEEAMPQDETAELVRLGERLGSASKDEIRGGYRNLFTRLPEIRKLAAHPAIRRWPASVLGANCFAVRAILFDKTVDANWKVAWHQDITIPVAERHDVPGYSAWSEKAGIVHVQPPGAVLQRMLTVRLHLDDCGAGNGPVRVLPGSHRQGIHSPSAVDDWKARVPAIDALVPAGGLLVMRPLLLHASSPATHPSRRRVIHIEYAAEELPGGLHWRERWGTLVETAA